MQSVGTCANAPMALLRVLTDMDLFTSSLAFVTPICLVRLGRACRALQIANCEQVLVFLGSAASSSRWREPSLMPKAGEKWSLERLHLCFAPPQFPLIHFDFANDALDEEARQSLESVAEILRRHPGLGLLVRGYARPEAPPDLGIALSQARAARVRSHLLGLLGPGRWQEDATEGLRQGGYSEGDPDLDRVLEFYRPRVVGRRIRAVGCWSETDMVSRRAGLGGGQSAEIVVDGFQESS